MYVLAAWIFTSEEVCSCFAVGAHLSVDTMSRRPARASLLAFCITTTERGGLEYFCSAHGNTYIHIHTYTSKYG